MQIERNPNRGRFELAMTAAVRRAARLAPAVIVLTLAGVPEMYAQQTPAPQAPTTPATPNAPTAPTTPATPASPALPADRGGSSESADPLTGRPIARVEVAGNNRTDAAKILDAVRTQPGQLYSRNAVDIDTRSIASMGRFLTVRAEVMPTQDDRVVVRFVVQERPLVTNLEIVGNRRKRDEQIRELIATQVGSSVDAFSIETDRKAIEEYYRRDGYNTVKITVDNDLLEKTGTVRFKIVEGPRSFITSVRFDGNQSLKSDFLQWKIKTKTHFWIFRKGVLNEDDVEADLATLRDTYVSKGFLDARISKSIEYSADKRKVTVRFVINEGPKYRVGKITISGNKVFGEPMLREQLVFNTGDYMDRKRIETSTKHIEDTYGSEGYIYRDVKFNYSYTDTPGVADVSYDITEGDAYAVGRVIVRGNQNTQDRVVRRQIRIYPDQTYDTVKVRKSIERLKSTRVFSDARITPIGNEPGVRDALVEVSEGQSGRFLVGAGVSTDSGVIGQLSLEQQNFDITNTPKSGSEFFSGQSFKGAGQYFRILLEPGTELQRYRVTFEEPYLFDTPYSFANDAYYFERDRESWTERRIGDIVTFGRRFNDVWAVTLALRAEDVNISNTEGDTSTEVIDEKGDHFLTSVKPGIVRDTTDSRIFPTTGTKTSFTWEQYGALGGDVEMSKLVAKFDWFTPVYTDIFDRKTVFSIRNEFGYIPIGDSVFFERFYGGGMGSIRGFKFRGISPRGDKRHDPVGGDFSWVTTLELNYPIWEEMLRGVVFVDTGTVERDIGFEEGIRSSFGAGLRITLPFFGQVPIAIDFGVPMIKQNGDKTQIVSFSLGIPF